MKVGIVMGSRSKWSAMQKTANVLVKLGVSYEARIISDRKKSSQLQTYVNSAKERDIELIIAASSNAEQYRDSLTTDADLPVLSIQLNDANKKANKNCSLEANPELHIINSGDEGPTKAALLAAKILAKKSFNLQKNLAKYQLDHTVLI